MHAADTGMICFDAINAHFIVQMKIKLTVIDFASSETQFNCM